MNERKTMTKEGYLGNVLVRQKGERERGRESKPREELMRIEKEASECLLLY
jgi:hypothetical protein